jgi:NAD(P)-dependent dehydrogenase (short-subunit alcohol dehydrogenase family)
MARPGPRTMEAGVVSSLDGKVAVITGAGSGIGAATVRELMDRGARVAALDLDADAAGVAAGEAIAGGTAIALTCDVRDAESCETAVAVAAEHFGHIDIVVNSAGVIRYGTVDELSIGDWQLQIETNLNGVFHICRPAIPRLRAAGGGAIVNVASTQAFASQERVPAYSASKGAVVALTRTMALDHARDGIRVNAVGPGSVDTAMLRYAAEIFSPDDPAAAITEWGERHPLGRVITPQEVARVVAFLASDDAGAVTGATYMVDAGATAKLST